MLSLPTRYDSGNQNNILEEIFDKIPDTICCAVSTLGNIIQLGEKRHMLKSISKVQYVFD
ncbi:MAG: hypothetical protein COA78_38160 [Blastopirellula sp.]|nr:MAG: hypothetical protein COA78_38160 [Blastopirellula sp.]